MSSVWFAAAALAVVLWWAALELRAMRAEVRR